MAGSQWTNENFKESHIRGMSPQALLSDAFEHRSQNWQILGMFFDIVDESVRIERDLCSALNLVD